MQGSRPARLSVCFQFPCLQFGGNGSIFRQQAALFQGIPEIGRYRKTETVQILLKLLNRPGAGAERPDSRMRHNELQCSRGLWHVVFPADALNP